MWQSAQVILLCWRALESHVLGLHHGVAHGAAEGHRLHLLDALHGGAGDQHRADHAHQHAHDEQAACAFVVEVDDGQGAGRGFVVGRCRRLLPAAQPDAHGDEHQAEAGHRRQQHVGDDAQVGATVEAGQLQADQQHDHHQRDERDDRAHQADPVAGDDRDEVVHHRCLLHVRAALPAVPASVDHHQWKPCVSSPQKMKMARMTPIVNAVNPKIYARRSSAAVGGGTR